MTIQWETYVLDGNTYTRCPNKDFVQPRHNATGHWYGYWNGLAQCPDCLRVSEWRRKINLSPRDSNGIIGSSGKHLFISDQQVNETRNELHALLQTLQ